MGARRVKVREVLPVAGQVAGVGCVVAAVAELAGFWWAVLLGGVLLVVAGVLDEAGWV